MESLDSTRYQHGFTETTGYQSNSVRLPVNDIFDDNPDSAEKLSDDNKRVNTLRTLHSEETSLNVFKKNREKMFLYHPDNPEHEDKVDKIRSVLHARDIILCNDKYDNWRDFAETAGKEFPEIVIILSEGLLKLCKAYENKANGHVNDFDVLRQQRNYEYTPCVAMKKLQTLIQENPDSCPFSLHLVSFECDDDLIEDFLNLYDCLKRTSCWAYYNLYISTSNITEQKVHRRNLKRLIKALNGLH